MFRVFRLVSVSVIWCQMFLVVFLLLCCIGVVLSQVMVWVGWVMCSSIRVLWLLGGLVSMQYCRLLGLSDSLWVCIIGLGRLCLNQVSILWWCWWSWLLVVWLLLWGNCWMVLSLCSLNSMFCVVCSRQLWLGVLVLKQCCSVYSLVSGIRLCVVIVKCFLFLLGRGCVLLEVGVCSWLKVSLLVWLCWVVLSWLRYLVLLMVWLDLMNKKLVDILCLCIQCVQVLKLYLCDSWQFLVWQSIRFSVVLSWFQMMCMQGFQLLLKLMFSSSWLGVLLWLLMMFQ